jgi:hypothetical protein
VSIVSVLAEEVERLRRETYRLRARARSMKKDRNRWREIAITLDPSLGQVTRTRRATPTWKRYATDEERLAARRRSSREYKRRARAV